MKSKGVDTQYFTEYRWNIIVEHLGHVFEVRGCEFKEHLKLNPRYYLIWGIGSRGCMCERVSVCKRIYVFMCKYESVRVGGCEGVRVCEIVWMYLSVRFRV